ncbi:alpha/beta hydrolase family protein [Microbacterium murale]|uniref:Pimeloyl-ACP methyl ester carboxylesterase n=1 Tax=Microbacterium murale TaxID=1081040 RepID=A0ABU0P746_9MICO|nr:alpha/beta fold hydrolase [Microbacterium murale]MDQ0643153.1 pimeloyl-ACP methyl ester carboxylesterase [Microbacterium murale]
MSASVTALRHSIRLSAAISTTIAARLALSAFFRPGPKIAVHERDAATDLAGHREYLRMRGQDIATYRWGTGPRTVLLLHGWQGRASQLAPLVRELVSSGYRVVSFDAPAHGASDGRRADVTDWLDASAELSRRYGGFEAIIGHCFGGLAGLTLARDDASIRSVAVIASAASPTAFLQEFSTMLELDDATRSEFERLFYARLDDTPATAIAHYDAVARPLPHATELLVIHDREDRRMPDAGSLRLHDGHRGRSRLIRTSGLGHARLLSDDAVLDAVVAMTNGGVDAVDGLEVSAQIGSAR